jgi:hypothetical protein
MEARRHKTEIRPEELKEILGIVPPWIMRWGSLIVSVVILLLISGALWVKFPVTVRFMFRIESVDANSAPCNKNPFQARFNLSVTQVRQVSTGIKAVLRFDGYPYVKEGILSVVVDRIENQPGSDNCSVYICLPQEAFSSEQRKIVLKEGMTGTALIRAGRESLLGRVIWPASGK